MSAPLRRTQQERTAATRTALIEAGRRLFTDPGYAAVGTEQIVQAAGVSRGALYHHFGDKRELFAAVLDAVEADLGGRIVANLAADPAEGVRATFVAGTRAFLDACEVPEVHQIALIDGTAVLGWLRWREICLRHGAGLVGMMLADAIARGALADQPVEPLAHVVLGALDEGALYVALANDRPQARAEVAAALARVIGGLFDR